INLCESASLWAANDTSPPSDPRFDAAADNFSLSVITEDAVAQRFAELSGDTLRYCHSTGAWFEWNDVVWQRNDTQRAFHWARMLARDLSQNKVSEVRVPVQKAS